MASLALCRLGGARASATTALPSRSCRPCFPESVPFASLSDLVCRPLQLRKRKALGCAVRGLWVVGEVVPHGREDRHTERPRARRPRALARQVPWSASDPSGCTVLDGCPTLGQDEDPGTPGLLPRQPYQAAQHHDATDHRHADEETPGHLGAALVTTSLTLVRSELDRVWKTSA